MIFQRLRLIDPFVRDAACRSGAIIGPSMTGKSTLLDQIAEACAAAGWWVRKAEPGRARLSAIMDEWDGLSQDQARRGLVVIDDFDPDDAQALRLVMADGGPLRFILAARADPATTLASLRLRGRIIDIETHDLNLTTDEASAFLGYGATALPDDFYAVMRETEGWFAPLSHVRNRLSHGVSIAMARRELRTLGQPFADFIDAEVLAGLSEADRRLLERASVFTAITAENLERAREELPQSRVEVLLRQKLLRPSREILGGHSINPSLRHVLEARLKERQPGVWRATLHAAAEDFIAFGKPLAAADCLIRLRDFERAAAILAESADQVFAGSGEVHAFFSLSQRLPHHVAEQFDHGFWIARGAALLGEFGYAAHLVDELDANAIPERAANRTRIIRILIALGSGDFAEVASRASALIDSGEGSLHDCAAAALASAQAHAGALNWAGHARMLEQARGYASKIHVPYFSAWVTIATALRLLGQGQLNEAEAELRRLLDRPDVTGPIQQTCVLVIAESVRLRGRIDEARAAVARAFPLGAKHGISETALLSLETVAKLTARDHGVGAALEKLSEAEQWINRGYGVHSQRLLRLLRIDLMLHEYDRDMGAAIQRLLDETDEWCSAGIPIGSAMEERIRLLRARHALAEGRARQALNLFQPIIAATGRQGRMLIWAEASLLRLSYLIHEDRRPAAFKALLAILDELAVGGATEIVVDNAHLLAPLARDLERYLSELTTRPEDARHAALGRLADRLGISREVASLPPDAEAFPSLTATELKIMRLVANGLGNAEVGRQLAVSLDTVKWHLHNVFRKLDVRNRTSAVRRLQQLQLVK